GSCAYVQRQFRRPDILGPHVPTQRQQPDGEDGSSEQGSLCRGPGHQEGYCVSAAGDAFPCIVNARSKASRSYSDSTRISTSDGCAASRMCSSNVTTMVRAESSASRLPAPVPSGGDRK